VDRELLHVIELICAAHHGILTHGLDSGTTGSSIFECQIYARRTIGSDDFIGGTSDRIDVLLTEGATGGLPAIYRLPFVY